MLIKVENLTHTYNEDTPFAETVLHNVSLEIEEGEMVGLVGPTCAGKSTLIQYFNGLFLPSRGKGKVVVDGVDTRSVADLVWLRRKVGLVFQYPEDQLFERTVFKDVAFGPRNLGLPAGEIDELVRSSLAAVGLDHAEVGERYVFALSGGQKRRVAIAGVLACNPRVVIFDEPTAGLDPRGREEILDVIRGLHTRLGLTVILVSNDLEAVSRLAQRLILIHDGRIVMTGTPREVFARGDALAAMNLRAPQTVEIMKALQERGFPVRLDVLTAEEACEEIRHRLPGRGFHVPEGGRARC